MNGFLATALAAVVALPSAALAQQSQNPVADALRQNATRAQRILVAAAEEMPAEKYSFKPTPAQMSFGQLVLHVAGSNVYMCSTISGEKAPEMPKLSPTDEKSKLVGQLQKSFDYCSTALAKVNDSSLGTSVPFFGGRHVSRAAAMMDLAADWADHYSASAIYLRLNGHLPPTARHAQAE